MDYKLYCISSENKVVSRHDYDVEDDLIALECAREICKTYEIEIWQDSRLVGRVATDGTASIRAASGPHSDSVGVGRLIK